MKRISVCMILISILSCSQPEDQSASVLMAKDDIRSAANPANPYDETGQVFDQVLDAYYAGYRPASTTTGIILQIEPAAFSVANFSALASTGYTSPLASRLDYFASNPLTAAASAISTSSLTQAGRTHLAQFVITSLPLCESVASFDEVYDIVLAYENSVLASSQLTVPDKRIILATTSVLRYSARRKRKPKKNTDHDWEINMTNIAPTIEGASQSPASAVTWAGAAGIFEN